MSKYGLCPLFSDFELVLWGMRVEFVKFCGMACVYCLSYKCQRNELNCFNLIKVKTYLDYLIIHVYFKETISLS